MKKSRVIKNDFNRVLLSETSPEDVPIIYSNTWFYNHMKQYQNKGSISHFKSKIIDALFISKSEDRDFVPLKYSILKSNGGLRHLGLLHPASQNQMVDLYQTFSQRIINHTSSDSFSIRSPYKISSICYYDNEQTKGSNEVPASTYFAYKKYTRLNKFFESKEFLLLERKYSKFWSLDISRFFENIYTHSISWAVKGKNFAKETRANSDFTKFFDQLMQRSNFNETNGIIIGNEVSRVFAEIILQAIDKDIIDELKKLNLTPSVDYDIKRYLDDYYVFASKNTVLDNIKSVLESKLRFYKLHLNESKTVKNERPFITAVTRAKLQTGESISWLFNTVFDRKDGVLVELRRPSQVKRKFVDRIMSASYEDKKAYAVMCGYVISSLHNQLIKVVDLDWFSNSKYSDIKNSLFILLDIAFHLFNVAPTSNNSVKLCSMCNLLHNYYLEKFPDDVDTVVLEVSILIKEFFSSCVVTQRENNSNYFVPIEFANLLCVSSSMGSQYLLSPKTVKEVFGLENLKKSSSEYIQKEDCFDYFNLMTVLFYIKNHDEYNRIKEEVVKEINKRLVRIDRISFDSRICYLLLDSMSCPYIEKKKKKLWSLKLEKVIYGRPLTEDESNKFLEELTQNRWFICWDDRVVLDRLIIKNNLLFGY